MLMLMPIDISHRGFPICCIPVKHDSAAEMIFEIVGKIIDFLRSQGIEIIGFATDGDHQYSAISRGFMNDLLNHIQERAEQMVSKSFYISIKIVIFLTIFIW